MRRALTRKRECGGMQEPVRLQVLRSDLPRAYKSNLFRTLASDRSEKTRDMVESVLRIPFGTYSDATCALEDEDASRFLQRAKRNMDDEIHGHELAKKEVLTVLARWRAQLQASSPSSKTRVAPYAIALLSLIHI